MLYVVLPYSPSKTYMTFNLSEKKYIKYIARNWYVLLLYSQQMETKLRS